MENSIFLLDFFFEAFPKSADIEFYAGTGDNIIESKMRRFLWRQQQEVSLTQSTTGRYQTFTDSTDTGRYHSYTDTDTGRYHSYTDTDTGRYQS